MPSSRSHSKRSGKTPPAQTPKRSARLEAQKRSDKAKDSETAEAPGASPVAVSDIGKPQRRGRAASNGPQGSPLLRGPKARRPESEEPQHPAAKGSSSCDNRGDNGPVVHSPRGGDPPAVRRHPRKGTDGSTTQASLEEAGADLGDGHQENSKDRTPVGDRLEKFHTAEVIRFSGHPREGGQDRGNPQGVAGRATRWRSGLHRGGAWW